MKTETTSEDFFAKVCTRHSYPLTKLDTDSGRRGRTPDFLVTTPHGDLLVEVKELRPNSEDRRYIRQMKELHHATHGGKVGSRARNAIRDAAAQLKRRRAMQIPMLIVLYDNVRTADGRVGMPMEFTELFHIDAAMYGFTVAYVPLVSGQMTQPDRAGGGRLLTESEKRYVNAICVLSDGDNESLYIYHNFFATYPLRVDVFDDPKCHHYVKVGHPWDNPNQWQEIGGQQHAAHVRSSAARELR